MANMTLSRLSEIPLFADVPDEELAHLETEIQHVTLKQGEQLFKEGDSGDTLYIIEQGRIRIYIQSVENTEVELDFAEAGDVLGELSLLDGKPRSASAVAMKDCQLLALCRDPFMEHLRHYPETAIHLLEYLSGRVRNVTLHTEALSLSDSAARLAHALLFLAERDGEIEPGIITTALRKKDLADAIGTSVEWVSQMLLKWCDAEIIGLTGRRLILHDVAALKALCRRED